MRNTFRLTHPQIVTLYYAYKDAGYKTAAESLLAPNPEIAANIRSQRDYDLIIQSLQKETKT